MLFASAAVSAQTYPIWVYGTQVTDTNASSITGPYISGIVQYIDSTHTLIFNGATVGDSNLSRAVLSASCPIKIMFVGRNVLMAHRCLPIVELYDSVEFISAPNAELDIRHYRCTQQMGSGSTNASITAKDIKFTALGTIKIGRIQSISNVPLIRATGSNEITISGGPVILYGSDYPIINYNRVNLINRYFTSPRNTYYDTTAKLLVNPICQFDTVLISEEYLQPYLRPLYPVKVAGTQVTVLNADSITGPGVSGHVSFDSISNTLTLENATITTTEHNGIEADSSITINCIGYNIVNCCNNDAISHSKIPLLLKGADFTIQGVSGNDTLAISTYRLPTISTSDNLHISNLNLLSNFGDGISKYDTNNTGDLTITNSIAKIIGGINCGPISMYNNLNLIQCEIVRPVGHRYSTANQRIEDPAGNLIRYLDTLVIEKSPVDILSAVKEKTELMPNPVSTNLHVVSESVIDQLQVFDTYGRLLKTLVPNTKRAIVNVRQMKNGVYTIKIKTDGGIITKRFVVRH